MDEFDDTRLIAIEESRSLLNECELILNKFVSGGSVIVVEIVAEIFQKIHTVKSNMALIPGSKTLSLAFQNIETVFSGMRDKNIALSAEIGKLVLDIIEQSQILLESIVDNKLNQIAEKEIIKSITTLRLKSNYK